MNFCYAWGMWFVYVLLCKDGSLYTGITDDVTRRFRDHVTGKGGRYTRSHRPVKIVHTESCQTKSKALKREAEIKRWPRDKKIENLHLRIE